MSTPITYFVESGKPLGAAFLLLSSVQDYLSEFAAAHPERMDPAIADAMDHVAAAFSRLDSDFYAEHEADPTFRRRGC